MRQTVINIRYGIMPVNGLAAYYVLSLFIVNSEQRRCAESKGGGTRVNTRIRRKSPICVGITFDTEKRRNEK